MRCLGEFELFAPVLRVCVCGSADCRDCTHLEPRRRKKHRESDSRSVESGDVVKIKILCV